MSQVELASAVGLKKQTINDIEGGRTATPLERACMIADALDVALDYLVGRDDVPNRKDLP